MGTSRQSNQRSMSMGKKVLLPFFLILTLLGSGATVVSIMLIGDALSKTADDRLRAFQQVVFREIKKQELLLGSYALLLQNAHTSQGGGGQGTGIVNDLLYTSLSESNISLAVYPAQLQDTLPYPGLRDLFSQASRSGKPRFRFTTEIGTTPTLAVAAPLEQGHILLQAPVSRSFLKQLSAPFGANILLLSADGSPLAASTDKLPAFTLSTAEMEKVITGQTLFKTEKSPLPHRHLYSAIPLGTTDLILLSLELPMADLDALVRTMSAGSVLAITLALLLGGYIYYRLIRQVMAPLAELLSATEAVGKGNLEYRIRHFGNDELGHLARSFNSMLSQLRALYADKVEQEKALALAKEGLRHQEIVEQKNREIETANRDLKSHLHELSALFQLNQAMISTLDLNLLFDRILQVLEDLLQCSEMVLLLYDAGAGDLMVRKAVGPSSERLRDVSFRLDEGITGAAARTQKLLYVPDAAADGRCLNYKGDTPCTGSLVSVPLVSKGNLGGVLNLHKEKTDAFSETELKMIQAIANQAAIALENARLYEQARSLSNTDELTGLANRRHFQEILKRETAHAKRYHSPFCLIMADIDHFKCYNDTHGHLMGDAVLRKVAALLLQNTRGIDLVGRFGGEEFIILLPKTDREGALAAAEKLRQRVAGELFSGAEQSQPSGRITLSLGVAEFPGDSKDIYELINFADQALYRAKANGRNRAVAWAAKPATTGPPPLTHDFPAP